MVGNSGWQGKANDCLAVTRITAYNKNPRRSQWLCTQDVIVIVIYGADEVLGTVAGKGGLGRPGGTLLGSGGGTGLPLASARGLGGGGGSGGSVLLQPVTRLHIKTPIRARPIRPARLFLTIFLIILTFFSISLEQITDNSAFPQCVIIQGFERLEQYQSISVEKYVSTPSVFLFTN